MMQPNFNPGSPHSYQRLPPFPSVTAKERAAALTSFEATSFTLNFHGGS